MNVATGAVSRLTLPPLVDRETGGALSELRDAAADQAGRRIAFSAVVADPKAGALRRIYACDLDGRDLRRLTPLQSGFVQPYRFPGADLSARDVDWEGLPGPS